MASFPNICARLVCALSGCLLPFEPTDAAGICQGIQGNLLPLEYSRQIYEVPIKPCPECRAAKGHTLVYTSFQFPKNKDIGDYILMSGYGTAPLFMSASFYTRMGFYSPDRWTDEDEFVCGDAWPSVLRRALTFMQAPQVPVAAASHVSSNRPYFVEQVEYCGHKSRRVCPDCETTALKSVKSSEVPRLAIYGGDIYVVLVSSQVIAARLVVGEAGQEPPGKVEYYLCPAELGARIRKQNNAVWNSARRAKPTIAWVPKE